MFSPAASQVQHVKNILARMAIIADDDRLTAQQRRRASSIELVRGDRPSGPPLMFNSRPFLLCGLPLKRPAAGTLVHRRRNGLFALEVTGHPEFGLPFGQDRLIPLWVASRSVRQNRREIHFETGAEILSVTMERPTTDS